MLLHDMGKPALKTMDETGRAHFKKHAAESEVLARGILKRLKFDNDTLRKVCRLIRFHDYRMEATEYNVRQAIYLIGEACFRHIWKCAGPMCWRKVCIRGSERYRIWMRLRSCIERYGRKDSAFLCEC